jgi:hypothetical protein
MPRWRDGLEIGSSGAEYQTGYSLSFAPDRLEPLARALHRAGHPVNGYTVEAVLVHLSEKGAPEWAELLEFDSENDAFVVRCRARKPLEKLLGRLAKRLADPAAMRRLVRSVPNPLME